MPLTDPELDLLREILSDDPRDDVYVQVGEELVRRGRWEEAEGVLAAGVAGRPEDRAFELLARAALECAHYDVALTSLERFTFDPVEAPELARVEILVHERSGDLTRARSCIDAFLQHDPNDVVVTAALERLEAPPPDLSRAAEDPFVSVERAERYVAVGRVDRAVRTYRRILFRYPEDPGLELRLRQLSAEESGATVPHDDLSEELTDPATTPPDLTMPGPAIAPLADFAAAQPDEEHTEPGAPLPGLASVAASDDEDTDLGDTTSETVVARPSGRGPKRRRRSLLNR